MLAEVPEAELPDINYRRICALIPSVHPEPVVSTLTPRIPLSVSLIFRPGLWWSARTSVHSTKQSQSTLGAGRARIKAAEESRRHEAEASERRNLLGSGDRSDRIRTYNFPQGRVTDHRINLTLYRLDEVMEGKLDALIFSRW